MPIVENFDGRRRWTSSARVISLPTCSRAGSSRNAPMSRCDRSGPPAPPSSSPASHVAPQPKPARPYLSRRSVNGHRSAIRNGVAATAMYCSHMGSGSGGGALDLGALAVGRGGLVLGRGLALDGGAPIGDARQLGALRVGLDERAAAVARAAGAVVDPQTGRRELLAGLEVDRRRAPGGRVGAGIRVEQLAGGREDPVERVVVEALHRREGI